MEMLLQLRQDSQSENAKGGRKWLKRKKCCPPPIQRAERGQNPPFLPRSAHRSETGSPVCLPAAFNCRRFPPAPYNFQGALLSSCFPGENAYSSALPPAEMGQQGFCRSLTGHASQRGFPDEWALPGLLPAREGFGRVLIIEIEIIEIE